MKTLNILALAFILLSSPLVADANDSGSHIDSIAARIQTTVHLPDALNTEGNQRVFVVFSIAENGGVMVHEVGTGNPDLKSSIVSQFQSMQFDNSQNEYDGMYSIWLNFKTL